MSAVETEGVSEGRDWHRTGAALVFALWRHALSGMKGLLVCWLADQWVTLCWHWYLSRKISPTDPIPVMHKKMTEVIFLFLFRFHSFYLIRAEQN